MHCLSCMARRNHVFNTDSRSSDSSYHLPQGFPITRSLPITKSGQIDFEFKHILLSPFSAEPLSGGGGQWERETKWDSITSHSDLHHLHLVMVDINCEIPHAYLEQADKCGDIVPLGIRRGDGFPRGCYFFIGESGTNLRLLNDHVAHTEGTLLHLWPLQPVKDVRRRNQVYRCLVCGCW